MPNRNSKLKTLSRAQQKTIYEHIFEKEHLGLEGGVDWLKKEYKITVSTSTLSIFRKWYIEERELGDITENISAYRKALLSKSKDLKPGEKPDYAGLIYESAEIILLTELQKPRDKINSSLVLGVMGKLNDYYKLQQREKIINFDLKKFERLKSEDVDRYLTILSEEVKHDTELRDIVTQLSDKLRRSKSSKPASKRRKRS